MNDAPRTVKPVVNKPRGLAATAMIQPVLARAMNLDREGAHALEARQARAARALLDWTEGQTASAAGITVAALGKIEKGATPLNKKAWASLQSAFDAAGVVLLQSGIDRDEGLGVRLRKAEP